MLSRVNTATEESKSLHGSSMFNRSYIEEMDGSSMFNEFICSDDVIDHEEIIDQHEWKWDRLESGGMETFFRNPANEPAKVLERCFQTIPRNVTCKYFEESPYCKKDETE
eukprot:GHVR01087314.1.p1 GENE.GHVR01087314.1~~GHVR01087314.1.p1  ORF type:complete len:110 (+),score=14.51 GHVR01087314.1:165-494(+)